MANKLKGEVEVEVGDGEKKRTLVFRLGINELIGLQEALGMGDDDEKFLATLDRLRVSLRKLRIGVRAALLCHQPDTTEEQAGEIITELGFRRVGEIFDQALRWALPEPAGAGAGHSKGKGGAAASPGPLPS